MLKGVILMIKNIFGCNLNIHFVKVDASGNITEELLQSVKNDQSDPIIAFDKLVIENEQDVAYLFRLDIEHNGKHSEVYLDLFDRNHKSNGKSATFTIQGSAVEKCDGMAKRQNPIAYLITSIALDQPFLSFRQIRDVFHELGHILHVALCKTEFQLINGSRVPIDFAEIPSHFTEQFVYDYDFMSQWIVDEQTGEPIAKDLFEKIVLGERVTEMINLQELIYFSLLDLHFHSLKENELTQEKLVEINSKVVKSINLYF